MAEDRDPSKLKRRIGVTGMTCATCARMVERSLKRVEGVTFAAVNLATETVFVVVDDEAFPQSRLEEAIVDAGYGFSYDAPEELESRRYAEARHNLLVSWAVTAPLMVLMALHMAGVHLSIYTLLELAGGLVVFLGAGRGTFKGAWIALSHRHANMDVLVVFGAVAAWATALLHMAGLPLASFGALGPMILALHITGRYIESRLRDRASKEIRGLLALQAREARIVDDDGTELLVPIEAVKEGHRVAVRPGERFPADGRISAGRTSVDESMITGESLPVGREEGAAVTGGSLNLTGSVVVEVTGIGDGSFLAQMIALIQEAQGAKIPIQAFADRVTNVFVPVIVGLALVAGTAWFFAAPALSPFLDGAGRLLPWVTSVRDPLSLALFAFITTVVIACPCALGLATPMALIAATARASRHGMVIRNAEAIQTAREVSVVVMDKTGTITEGRPAVVDHDLSADDLAAAAAVERQSSHPLAKAIAEAVPAHRQATDVAEEVGQGVEGRVDGILYSVGRPDDAERYRDQLDRGRTVVEVRREGRRLGFISVEDPLRDDAAEAVRRLKALGIRPVMATGDNGHTARAVAGRAGIDEVHASVRPEGKLDLVRDLQARGAKVLMVGDGMNDAAALKGADVGLAIGSGTDLAIDSADIVLVRGGLSAVAEAVTLSRKTFSVIGQNLFWAFGYNVIAVPLAMAALLHPLIAETAMAFSSISVLLNSQRINRE